MNRFTYVTAVGITALVGCGSPSPDGPVSGPTSGSAAAVVVSPPAGDAPRADPAAHGPASLAPTQTSPLGPTAQQISTTGARSTDGSRASSPVSTASPTNTPQPDARAEADQAQYEARQQWLAELREHPIATVRLEALELWAQKPGDDLDPVLEALGDDDEQVKVRAEELWKQQLTREEAKQ